LPGEVQSSDRSITPFVEDFMADSLPSLPSVGAPAPDFTVSSHTGETISLSDFKGKQNVVLFFYPKADTPGCTIEACSFRDNVATFQAADTAVLGISADPVKKQAKFADKFGFTYPLLADADRAIAEAYGVWKEKTFMGRKFMGIERTTFVIDKNGVIRSVFPKVSIPGHTAAVLAAVQELQ
jgi:peroxiredoxin Q/BCP